MSVNLHSGQLLAAAPVRAAQYVRMSTEHQRYSTLNQMDALRVYAAQRRIEIVQTYADEGKSGLSFGNRPALRQLIQDVVSGSADFSIILVYDVSRWGRFQDADESAHYEFLCRQSGIQVRYCAEPFENDGSPLSTLVKGIKRLMAAEYSRELSVKVFSGQMRSAKMGYHPGSPAGLGLRRLLVDPNGIPKEVLQTGQHKNLMTDRTILVPGPREEVSLVRRIFRECAAGKSINNIAAALNARGVRTVKGNQWSDSYVGVLLHNEKYIGNVVWNKKSIKLRGRAVRNSPTEWVRADGAYQPIVSRDLFDKVQQAILERKTATSAEEMLAGLRRLLAENGRLDIKLVSKDKRIPSPSTYHVRFGGLLKAYEQVGYTPKSNRHLIVANRTVLGLRSRLAARTADALRQSGRSASVSPDERTISIDSSLVVQFIVLRCRKITSGALRWFLRPASIHKAGAQIIIVVRMKDGDQEILDYHLFPKDELRMVLARMSERNGLPWDAYRCDTLEPLYTMLARGDSGSASVGERIVRTIAEKAGPPLL